jgi:hypothetical protein
MPQSELKFFDEVVIYRWANPLLKEKKLLGFWCEQK